MEGWGDIGTEAWRHGGMKDIGTKGRSDGATERRGDAGMRTAKCKLPTEE